jgi:hypothetical protein
MVSAPPQLPIQAIASEKLDSVHFGMEERPGVLSPVVFPWRSQISPQKLQAH